MPWTRLAHRWRAWWNARHPASDVMRCTQRTVYIVPTGAGALFALLLLVLLIASINYQLNLGYLLTFLLAGIGLTSMHGTHATLRGLEVRLQVGEPVFLDEAQAVSVTLHNAAGRERHGIGLRWSSATEVLWADVAPGDERTVHLRHTPERRGTSPLPRLVIETRFPFGLFRAWSYLRAASPAQAWPRAESPAAPLPSAPAVRATGMTRLADAAPSDTDGVRPYRRGDPLQHIAWKKSAQSLAGSGGLVSRERTTAARGESLLDWAATAGLDTERRLSRLCAWVLIADRSGQPYALALPDGPIERGSGAAHRRRCLERLAQWQT